MVIQACKVIISGMNATECPIMPIRRPYFRWSCVLSGIILAMLLIVLYATPAKSQTLNEAVTNQLDYGPTLTQPCFELRDEGSLVAGDVFTGSLVTLCTRAAPLPGAGPSVSAGGGAATPTTIPSVVQQRLREAHRKEKKPEMRVTAASADDVSASSKKMGLFITVGTEELDRDVTTFEDGYDSDLERLTVGADFQITARWVAGLAFNYYQHEGDFNGGGKFQTDSNGIIGFMSFLPSDNVFVQVTGGWARKDYERSRFAALADSRITTEAIVPVVSGLTSGDYKGDNFHMGALAMYDFHISNVIISPWVGLDWSRLEFDSYSEQGSTIESKNDIIAPGDPTGLELRFYDDNQTSIQSSIGVQASMVLMSGFWTVVPQASVNWKHEFENDQRDVDVSFVGDTRAQRFPYQTEEPDRDWGEINLGVVVVSPGGVQVFGNYRTLTEHDYFDSDVVTIGLRVPF